MPPPANAYAQRSSPSPAARPARLFDCHLESDLRSDEDLGNLAYFGVSDAWVYFHERNQPSRHRTGLERRLERLVTGEEDRLRAAGIRPFLAPGIPAAWVALCDVASSIELLSDLASNDAVVAIGGIGLGTGSPREARALGLQLEIASDHDLRAIVCLSPTQQAAAVRRIAWMAGKAGLDRERLCFAHANLQALVAARRVGATVVLSVHPADRPPDSAATFLQRHGPKGVCLASMLGTGPADVLALPRALRALEEHGADFAVRVFRDNALAFLGLPEES